MKKSVNVMCIESMADGKLYKEILNIQRNFIHDNREPLYMAADQYIGTYHPEVLYPEECTLDEEMGTYDYIYNPWDNTLMHDMGNYSILFVIVS